MLRSRGAPASLSARGLAVARQVLERAVEPLDEVDRVGHGVGRHQGDEVAVLDDVGQFVRLVTRIDRHDHAAAEGDGEERLDELGAGVHQHADVVARADAQGLQRAGTPQRVVGQLAVGQRAVGEHQRQGVGTPVGRRQQQVADGGDVDARARQVLRRQQRDACGRLGDLVVLRAGLPDFDDGAGGRRPTDLRLRATALAMRMPPGGRRLAPPRP